MFHAVVGTKKEEKKDIKKKKEGKREKEKEKERELNDLPIKTHLIRTSLLDGPEFEI